MKFRFGEFVLDTGARTLLCRGVEIPIQPKVFDCIELLASQPGQLVTMDAMRARLWSDVHVGDGALRRLVNEARQAVGDAGASQHVIRTRKGLGYVFVAATIVSGTQLRASVADPSQAWPFVGRQREIDVLRSWLSRPTDGGLCFVSGEAGAGKSSLLEALEQRTGAGLWLSGRCHAGVEQPAFWPFRELASQLAKDPVLQAQARNLARHARSVLAAIPELAGPEHALNRELGGTDLRFELCEAYAGMLRTLSRVRPLYITLEDVHWADEGSVMMLEAVARAARGQALFVFATYRSEDVVQGRALRQLIARTSGRAGVINIELGPLGLESLEALLGAVHFVGSGTLAASTIARLTGGNALFVHELVRHALLTTSQFDASLPPKLNHIVAQRVGLLPDSTRERLEQAAVLGHEFSIELLSALAGDRCAEAPLVALEPALRAGLLRRVRDRPDRLQFSHALVGDALAESLPLQQRQTLHASALRALLRTPALGSSAALAMHAFHAGALVPVDERRRLCERAGREAFDRMAFDRAAVQLGRSVQLLAADDASREAAELTLLWAQARWHADDPEVEVDATLLQAATLARRAGQPELLARSATMFAVGDESCIGVRTVLLRPEALLLVEEAQRALGHATPSGADALIGDVPYRLAMALAMMRAESSDLADLERATQLAMRLAPAEPDPVRKLWLLGLCAASNPTRMDEVQVEVLAELRRPGLGTRQRIEVLIMLMSLHLAGGRLAEYERTVQEITQLVALLGQPARIGRMGERLSMYVGIPLTAQVTLAIIRGQLADALQLLAAMPEQAERLGLARTRLGDNNLFAVVMQLHSYRGHSHPLESGVDGYLVSHPEMHWFCAYYKTLFALERLQLETAAEHFRILRESNFYPLLRGQQLMVKPETLVRIADACTAVGNAADAALLYGRLLPHAHYHIRDGALISWGSAGRPLGELALQLGLHAAAERHFDAALTMNERFGHRPELARTQLGLARLWLTTDRASEAEDLLATARASALTMGMAGVVAQVDRLNGSIAR